MVEGIEKANGSQLNGRYWKAIALCAEVPRDNEPERYPVHLRRITGIVGVALLAGTIGGSLHLVSEGKLGGRILNDQLTKGILVYWGENLDMGCGVGFTRPRIIIQANGKPPEDDWAPAIRCQF